MKMIRVKYISDIPSIFFKKGEIYEGYVPKDDTRFYAFHIPEYEDDGDFAVPASRFEKV